MDSLFSASKQLMIQSKKFVIQYALTKGEFSFRVANHFTKSEGHCSACLFAVLNCETQKIHPKISDRICVEIGKREKKKIEERKKRTNENQTTKFNVF